MPESFVPLSVPHLIGNASRYLQECVESGFVSSVGKFVDQLEAALARVSGANHAVAVMNGTSALHLALLVSGVEKDQEVIVPSLTFVATANAVRYLGAFPVFADVDPYTWNLDATRVEEFLRDQCTLKGGKLVNQASGREVVGILPVHLYGNPVDIPAFQKLAEEFKLCLIEDAAESIGATLNGQMTGTFGKCGVLSFNGNKTVTSGAGGAILTDDTSLADRAKHLSTQAKTDPYRYLHDEVGFNYRMSNIQAALGLAQLEQLSPFLERKREIHQTYREQFSDLVKEGIITFQAPLPGIDTASTWWLNSVLIKGPKNKDLDEPWFPIAQALGDRGIGVRPFWHPLHLLEPNRHLQVLGGSVTEELCRFGLCLPSSPSLTETEQARVIDAVQKAVLEHVC